MFTDRCKLGSVHRPQRSRVLSTGSTPKGVAHSSHMDEGLRGVSWPHFAGPALPPVAHCSIAHSLSSDCISTAHCARHAEPPVRSAASAQAQRLLRCAA